MEQHSSQDPWGWLSIFSSGSRAFHASGGEPKWTQRWHNKKLTKRQVKAKRSGDIGREHNKTTTCPNSAGLLLLRISSPHVFLLTDSELQRHMANGKLSPGAKVEVSLAVSQHDDSALGWEFFLHLQFWTDWHFTVQVTVHWSRLPREAVEPTSLTDTFENCLHLILCKDNPAWPGIPDTHCVPFQTYPFWHFAENEVKVATWGMGCGRAAWLLKYAEGGNCADTNTEVHLGQKSPLLKAFQKLDFLSSGNACLHFSQQVAAPFSSITSLS